MQFSQALQSVIWLDCSQLTPTDVDPLPHPHSKWQSVVGGGGRGVERECIASNSVERRHKSS